MADENDQTHHEDNELDPYISPAGAANGTEDSEVASLNDDKKLKLLFADLARLRSVRAPGRGKLTLGEAVAAARAQGEAYKRWMRSKQSLGELRVLVEGEEMMAVTPRLAAQLKRFVFAMPSQGAAVLQLTTQARGGPVVLFSLPLRDVPPEGLRHTADLPDGGELTMTILREQRDRFCVEVVVNPHQVEEPVKVFRKAVGGNGTDATENFGGNGRSERVATKRESLFRSLGFGTPALAFGAAALVFALLLVPLAGLIHYHWTCSAQSCDGRPGAVGGDQSTAADDGARGPRVAVAAANIRALEAARPMAKTGATVERQSPAAGSTVPQADKVNVLAAQYDPATRRAAVVKAAAQAGREAGGSRWEPKYARLATVHSVHVKALDAREAAASDALENVRVLVVRELEASKRFTVVNDISTTRPDAIIDLRLELEEERAGTVFLNVRDSKGKFLWQDFAGYSERPDLDQRVACADTSARLVSQFSGAVGLAQQNSRLLDLTVTGP